MPKKERKFADDGWAIWVDGEDTSTVYINDWLNPKGKSYVDIAVRIRGVSLSNNLHVYVPFALSSDEIDDVSLLFNDTKILQATFSATCIVDYMKNQYTSEIAYNGKTVDILHISRLDYKLRPLARLYLSELMIFASLLITTRHILSGACHTNLLTRYLSPALTWEIFLQGFAI